MEQGVKALMEMGIPMDVATDAMQKTNGNLEDAVNFIFSNELPANNNNIQDTVPIGPEPSEDNSNKNNSNNPFLNNNYTNDHVQLNDTNSQLRPGDLSHLLHIEENTNNSNNNGTTTPISEDYQYDSNINDSENIPMDPSSIPSSSSSSATTTSDNENLPDYSIMKQPIQKTTLLNPTIVLPLPPNSLIESYLTILALGIAKFIPKWFLIPDFKDLNYDPDWFKGLSLKEPLYKLLKDNTIPQDTLEQLDENLINDIQPESLWQLQKLISVVNNPQSRRSYISANIFTLAFDNQLRLHLQATDRLNEILPTFIKSLVMDLEICPQMDKNSIRNTFISSATYKQSDSDMEQESFVLLLHFPPEEYDTNLYKMFNALLYPDDDEMKTDGDSADGDDEVNNIAENSLKTIAPFFTIIFSEMDDMTEEDISLPEGVQVPFEFYPQLYTVTAKQQLIKHIITKRRQAHKRLKTCLHEIQHLKNFQGKDIVSVLDSGINFMEFDNDEKNKLLLNSLKSVKEKISDKLRVLKDEYRDITNKLHKEWNLSHPEYHLIESAKQMGIIDEPYLLIMVTISPYFYFIRDKRNMNQWTLIQSNTYGTDFQIINDIDEAKVEEVISKYTTRPNQTPIMFNYCKRSHINSDENISEWIQANEGCKKFMEADEKWFDENILNEEDNNSVTSDLIDTT